MGRGAIETLMNRLAVSEKFLFFMGLIIFALMITVVYAFTPKADAEPFAGFLALQETAVSIESVGIPVRLQIPKLGIDVALGSVGLTAEGALDAPKGPAEAAWYHHGPRPGEKGSAVIDGHSGWKDGIHAIFDELDTLEKGDQLYVTDDLGTILTFEVRETRMYDRNDPTTEVFDSNDGLAHLNLITCEGIWNKMTKSYSQRLVVLTDRIYE